MKNLKKAIFKLLNDPEPSERRRAAEELAQGDERAVYPLVKALKDPNTAVQEAATQSLISVGLKDDFMINSGEFVTYMVIPLLREEEAYLRNTAILIIKEIGHKAPHLIIQLLKDKDPDIRKFALDLLAEIKKGFNPSVIVPLLKDGNSNVRAAAVRAIGELGYRDGIPALIDNLKDEEWVVFYVLQALSQLKAESVSEQIGGLLFNTDSILIKAEVIETLGKIGTEKAVSPLLKYFPLATRDEKREIVKAFIRTGILPEVEGLKEEIISILKEDDWEEKIIALRGVKLTNLRDAIPFIVDEAGGLDPACFDYDEKIQILEDALLSINSEDELIKTLQRNDLKYRAKAFIITLLGKMKSKKALPVLIQLLEDSKRDIRIATAKALGEIGDEAAIQSLIKSSTIDMDANVRKTAIEALGILRAQSAYDTLFSLLDREKYPDIMETIVSSLIAIDQGKFLKNLKQYKKEIKQILAEITLSVDVLQMLLDSEDRDVKRAAIYGLGRVATIDAISKILEYLNSEDKELRKAAIFALGEANFCSEELFQCLKDEDPWIRYFTVKSIHKAAEPQTLLEKLTPLLDDPFPPVVIAAVEALADVATEEVKGLLLLKVNHPDRSVREKIEEIIQK